MHGLERLIRELHRRSLWQVLALYAGASWIVFEVVQTLTEGLGLPGWLPSVALVLLLVGLPVVLATAFVQEGLPSFPADLDLTLRPEIEHDADPDRSAPGPGRSRRLLTWRNAVLGGVLAFALWGIVATAWLLFADRPPPPSGDIAPAPSPERIAVLPFTVHGSGELAYLGDGIVHLLSTKLDGAGDLRTVDPRGLLSAVQRAGTGAPDPAAARALARRFGAGLFILGDIVEAEGRVQLDAALYEVAGDLEPETRASQLGQPGEVFDVVDRVAAQLVAGLEDLHGGRMARIAAVTTSSIPALKAYLEGESRLRRGDLDRALESFRAAVVADTGFALAYYRISVTAGWLDQLDVAREAVEAAARRADRLSERDRRSLAARAAWIDGAAPEAERLYREVVGASPTDVEAWWQLGELLFHGNPQRGRSVAASREPWERVLRLEPGHGPALLHLTRIAILEGNDAELDSLIAAARESAVGAGYQDDLELLRSYARAGPDGPPPPPAGLDLADDHTVAVAVWNVATVVRDLRATRDLARLLTAPTRSPGVRALGHLDLAHIELGLGRWRAAQQQLDSLRSLNPAAALEYRAWLAMAPGVPASAADLAELRDSLARADAAGDGAVPVYASPDSAARQQIRSYLLARLDARSGEVDAALRHVEELPRLPGTDEARALGRSLAREARAALALQNGDPTAALAALDAPRPVFWDNLAANSGFYSGAHERFLRARALEAAGRPGDAIRWYGTFAGHSIYDLAYLAPSHLARARLYDALEQPDSAARHYRELARLWSDADPAFRDLVEQAGARVGSMIDNR